MKDEENLDMYNRETIVLSIVQKRSEMLQQAQKNGLGAKETVNCSQELDELMNQLVLLDN
ncbi:aspartyl-phosphate phosphatase Spo0E family protein [Oceanobacillus sp. CFH 90083]|uniref:aspartyl-phosphate phosphatase Spo0E family protein n=1 Tax=Oceanobacillus sp. CFH 90083 TaxID=2592336 RepID=UPI001D132B67|nr:aspartyl-phosphate phosphatase Spo0E family protein [Oceanobacillus sp. CFH 90083]